jgi:hypothetical protein
MNASTQGELEEVVEDANDDDAVEQQTANPVATPVTRQHDHLVRATGELWWKRRVVSPLSRLAR